MTMDVIFVWIYTKSFISLKLFNENDEKKTLASIFLTDVRNCYLSCRYVSSFYKVFLICICLCSYFGHKV